MTTNNPTPEAQKADLETRLARSAERRRFYDAVGDTRSGEIERHVSDRLLDEWATLQRGING